LLQLLSEIQCPYSNLYDDDKRMIGSKNHRLLWKIVQQPLGQYRPSCSLRQAKARDHCCEISISRFHSSSSSSSRKENRSSHDNANASPVAIHTSKPTVSSSAWHRLKTKAKQWLDDTTDAETRQNNNGRAWTRRDVTMARSLLNDLLRPSHSHWDQAPWATRILNRWMKECHHNRDVQYTLPELMDTMHRVLFAWRKAALEIRASDLIPLQESIRLINFMEEVFRETNDKRILPGSKAYSLVLTTLSLYPHCLSSVCDDAIALLKQCTSNKERSVDVTVWNSCLHVLAKASRFHSIAPQRAEQLLESMLLDPRLPRPSVMSFASVLDAWATSPQPGSAMRARAILDRMMTSAPYPNTACFNICIGAYAKSQEPGSAQHAQDLLDSMLSLENTQARPDQRSFIAVMKAWANCTDAPKAVENVEATLEKLQQLFLATGDEKFRPTGVCYIVVLDACSRRAESGPKVESMLRNLEEELFKEGKRPHLETDRKHGQSIIQACYLAAVRAWANTYCDKNAPEHAERLLFEMEELSSIDDRKELAPTPAIYSAVISAWSKRSRVDAAERALKILRHMQDAKNQVYPDTTVWNAVLNVFAKQGDAAGSLALLDEMKGLSPRSDSAKPDSASYATVIHALSRSQQMPRAAHKAIQLLDELVQLYEENGEKDMQPTAHSYNSAITACGNSGESDSGNMAESIFWNMVQRQERLGDTGAPRPNTLVCNSVLRSWSLSETGGAPDRAEFFFKWMQEQAKSKDNVDVAPDIVSYIYVMRAWVQSRRSVSVSRIESHLDRMLTVSGNKESHSLRPNVSVYNLLLMAIKNSCDVNRGAKCQALLQQLVSASRHRRESLFDLASFHTSFLACLPVSRDSKANSLAAVETVQAIFKSLELASESNSIRLTNSIVVTALQVYFANCRQDTCDKEFLSQVFQFCSTKKGELNSRVILSSLRKFLTEQQYSILADVVLEHRTVQRVDEVPKCSGKSRLEIKKEIR